MKRFLLLTVFNVWTYVLIAQSPTINGYTVIPQNPTPADFIKIVIKVTTPSQGILVDINHVVTGQHIKLTTCYWQGMLPATQTFVDTFMIGQLPAANYQIIQKAYLSANQQWCNKTDSNSVMGAVLVSAATAIKEWETGKSLRVFPNPAAERINIPSDTHAKTVLIFSPVGALLATKELGYENSVDIHDLPQGLYYVRITTEKGIFSGKFVKSTH